jgi:transposase-like protein
MKKQFTPKEKAAVALEAIREIKTTSQVASEYQVHPIQVGVWKKQLLTSSPKIFSEKSERNDQQKTIDELYKIIGQREAELAWLKKKLSPFNSP